MQGIPQTELQAVLAQVEQAIHNHLEWYEFIARTLICRLPFDAKAASSNAHRECTFGRWYYGHASEKLRAQSAFLAIEAHHKEMHDLASSLLRASAAGQIAAADYDHFTRRMASFRLELESLRTELQSALGNLDPLTGANNRVGMLTWLRTQQDLVKRRVMSCGIAMIDLDHFKSVNDTYGHPAGDAVLSGVSRYLLEHIRAYDRLYRYGGEEFLLCMPGADLSAAFAIMDRLRVGLAGIAMPLEEAAIRCQVSCGVALLEPDSPVEQSIDRADKALYQAKAKGRNCTQAWTA